MALMDCRALWWLELLRKTARTENHGSRMEAVLSYPRRVHHGKTTSVNPVGERRSRSYLSGNGPHLELRSFLRCGELRQKTPQPVQIKPLRVDIAGYRALPERTYCELRTNEVHCSPS